MIGSLFTSTHTVTSGPISLVVTTPAPTVTEITSANAAAGTAATAAASTTQNISANGKLCSYQDTVMLFLNDL